MTVFVKQLWLVAVLTVSLEGAEVELRQEGGVWLFPEGVTELKDDAFTDGVCFTADRDLKVIDLARDMEWDSLWPIPLSYQVQGKRDRVTLTPVPEGMNAAPIMIGVVCDKEWTSAFAMKAVHPGGGAPAPLSFGSMKVDSTGVEEFKKAISEGVDLVKAKNGVPRMQLIVRSDTSFGRMVEILKIVNAAGCHSGSVKVNDAFPNMGQEFMRDPMIDVPINPKSSGGAGRITIEIRDGGLMFGGGGEALADDSSVSEYLVNELRRIEKEGCQPKLLLKGHKAVMFKHIRRVIRLATKVGVDQVVFASLEASDPKEEANGDDVGLPEVRRKVDVPLPFPANPDKVEAQLVEVLLKVNEKGWISRAHGVGILDKDPKIRELPGLDAELRQMVQAAGGEATNLAVQIQVSPGAMQQRLIDVLNVLSNIGITKVTFVDLAD